MGERNDGARPRPGAQGPNVGSGALGPTTDQGTTADRPEPSDARVDARAAQRRFVAERLPLLLFGAFVVAAAPLVLFRYGSYHWFFRDDFEFLANRTGTFPPVFRPHGGPHWVALPRLVYAVLWRLFGLNSYLPYQACVVALHLATAVLLRAVMRRAGVGPWLASAAAAVLVLFGPGAQNIVWAFQISFTGALALGLVALLLTDHDGPFSRRDVLAVVAGLGAVMASGVGITMAVVVALAVFLRRGWRPALAFAAPLAVVYGTWSVLADAQTDTPFGRPSVGALARWVESAQIGTFLGLGHFRPVAILLALILVAGLVLAVGPWRRGNIPDLRRRLAAPVALFVGGVVFAATTGLGRWQAGVDAARGSRYIYLGAACTLPLLAVAAQELARRWRPLAPALVGLLLLPIPFNLDGFSPTVFGPGYMAERERILTTAVRMPFAADVPADVQPIPDVYSSDAVDMGFLLGAEQRGDLTPSSTLITGRTIAEFRVRLGVAARPAQAATADLADCRPVAASQAWDVAEGDRFLVSGPVAISASDDAGRFGPLVTLGVDKTQNELTIELPRLRLRIQAAGPEPVTVCRQE